ncbi:MAG: S8 family serine peptidase, partial [Bacteroidetes bacterium]|nr:S8 family serine peptidase [Bacteroidota bacterium]
MHPSFIRLSYFAFCLFPFLVTHKLMAQSFRIKLQHREAQIDMCADYRLAQKEFLKGRWGNDYYSLVYYDRTPDARELNALKLGGGAVVESVSDNFLLVRFSQMPTQTFFMNSGIKAVGQMPAKEKLSKNLLETLAVNEQAAEGNVRVSILLHDKGNVADFMDKLATFGFVSVNSRYRDGGIYVGDIPTNRISDIASLPCVKSVGLFNYEAKPLLFRENAAFGLQNLRSETSGKGLSGKDVTIGIGDNADPTSHLDNLSNNFNRNPSSLGASGHGTAVTGIVSGDGIIDERFTGVAPRSTTVTDDFDLVISKSETYAKDFGMTVTNNSYYIGLAGCSGNGAYNELSAYADLQIATIDTIQHIFAAGNDGELTCAPYPVGFGTIKSGYQTAKNVLSVGNYSLANLPRIIGSNSSRGPVMDGRLKPEIIASGMSVVSTTLNDAYTHQNWGTSFAAPFVAGVWALLTEDYRKKNNGKTPPSGLLKSILCNSASDKGNPGPDYTHGFGLINPNKAVEVLEERRYVEGTISNGEKKLHSLNLPIGVKQVKIMLYWHDRPGSPLSVSALQNDLDLSVADGSSNYLPWVLNPSPTKVNDPAVRSVDKINNIEQVTINNPGNKLDISVLGATILGNEQPYYLTWDYIIDNLQIVRPAGGEILAAGGNEFISWDAIDRQGDSVAIEYSLDKGVNWSPAVNSDLSRMFIGWAVPANIASNQAKIRITRLRDGKSSMSPGVFTIVGTPQITMNTVCDGSVDITWTEIGNATDYEILQLKGYEWSRIGVTSGLKFSIRGLNKFESYWFTVRARIQEVAGRRAVAKIVIPKFDAPCQSDEFNNDLTIDTLLTPQIGRQLTSSAFGVGESVKVGIKNLDNVASPGPLELYYQINKQIINKEVVNQVIAPGGILEYSFNAKSDLSQSGSYQLKVWVKQPGDNNAANDTLTALIRHLPNTPLQLPYSESFETTGKNEYVGNAYGLRDLERFDLFTSSPYGRARTFVNTGMALNGNRSLTLDAAQFRGGINTNYLL